MKDFKIVFVKEDFDNLSEWPCPTTGLSVTHQYVNRYDCPGIRAVKRVIPEAVSLDSYGITLKDENHNISRMFTDSININSVNKAAKVLKNGAEQYELLVIIG